MNKTEDFIINRLMWKAKQYRLPTAYAFYFDELPEQVKEQVAGFIAMENCGTPVLFFTKPTNEWTIVCSRKVIWNNNMKIQSLSLGDIKRIMPAGYEPGMVGKAIDLKTVKKKEEMDEIDVVDKQGNINVLTANKGSDLFSLWNILLMVKRFYD